VSDLFGVLFLFLIEKERVEDATEENRFSAQDAIVDHQPHAFCCFQGMGLRPVLFYQPIRFARTAGDAPKNASLQYAISIWIWIPMERPASFRSGRPMRFQRRMSSSRHPSGNTRFSGEWKVSLSNSRKAP
jgi:hypothetical protein